MSETEQEKQITELSVDEKNLVAFFKRDFKGHIQSFRSFPADPTGGKADGSGAYFQGERNVGNKPITFLGTDKETILAWLRKNNEEERRQIYWQVGETDPSKWGDGAGDDWIKGTKLLWVDVDRAEAVQSWKSKCPLHPQIIVNSGNGHHVYWRLKERFDTPDTEQLEALNDLLALLAFKLGGDTSCRNPARLLRVPGTINWPNKKKREAGKKPALCRIEETSDYPEYSPFDVMKALLPDHLREKGEMGVDAYPEKEGNRSGALHAFNLSVLAWAYNLTHDYEVERVREGDRHKEYPRRFGKALSAAALFLASGNPDEKWHIYDHCREKGGREGAMRQCRQAIEDFQPPDRNKDKQTNSQILLDINKKLAFNMSPNIKPSESHLEFNDDGTLRGFPITTQLDRIFAQFPWIWEGRKDTPTHPSKFWTAHPLARQIHEIFLNPNRPPGSGTKEECGRTVETWNTWCGFPVEEPEEEIDEEMIRPFKDHLRKYTCRRSKVLYEYVWNWMAHMVQNPGDPIGTALVLIGDKGCGKTLIAEILGKLFHQENFCEAENSSTVTNHFNAHLPKVVFLRWDEASVSGPKSADILKSLITARSGAMEAKGKDVVLGVKRFLHIMVLSNGGVDRTVAPVETGDRRFVILETGSPPKRHTKEKGAEAYWKALAAIRDEDKKLAMVFKALKRTDLSNFNPAIIPLTRAWFTQLKWYLSSFEKFLWDAIKEGTDKHPLGEHSMGTDSKMPDMPTKETVFNNAHLGDLFKQYRANSVGDRGRNLSFGDFKTAIFGSGILGADKRLKSSEELKELRMRHLLQGGELLDGTEDDPKFINDYPDDEDSPEPPAAQAAAPAIVPPPEDTDDVPF